MEIKLFGKNLTVRGIPTDKVDFNIFADFGVLIGNDWRDCDGKLSVRHVSQILSKIDNWTLRNNILKLVNLGYEKTPNEEVSRLGRFFYTPEFSIHFDENEKYKEVCLYGNYRYRSMSDFKNLTDKDKLYFQEIAENHLEFLDWQKIKEDLKKEMREKVRSEIIKSKEDVESKVRKFFSTFEEAVNLIP